jgi:hypothetical protein
MGSQIDSIENQSLLPKQQQILTELLWIAVAFTRAGYPAIDRWPRALAPSKSGCTPKLPGLESQPPSLAERLLGRCDVWAEKIPTAGWSSRSTTIFTLFFQIVKLGEVYRVVIEGE